MYTIIGKERKRVRTLLLNHDEIHFAFASGSIVIRRRDSLGALEYLSFHGIHGNTFTDRTMESEADAYRCMGFLSAIFGYTYEKVEPAVKGNTVTFRFTGPLK